MTDVTSHYMQDLDHERTAQPRYPEVRAAEHISKAVAGMISGRVSNYATAGLSSWQVGGPERGMVRLFTASRDTRDWITPHSHRFDFTCLVLRGTVTNVLYTVCETHSFRANAFAVGTVGAISGGMGRYHFKAGTDPVYFEDTTHEYEAGDTYSMLSHEVHSIRFSKGAEVLFFEGPTYVPTSVVLEPWVDGARVPTFRTEPWMFVRVPD